MTNDTELFSVKIKDILKNFRFWILIFFLFLSFIAIDYSFKGEGVAINGVSPASEAERAGFEFDQLTSLTSRERILFVGNNPIEKVTDYYLAISELEKNSSIRITTDKNSYLVEIPAEENRSIDAIIGLSVQDAANSNIRLGIDLEGGSRLILKPQDELTDSEFDLLVNTLQSRLDVFGASGTKVNKLEDAFSNEKFVIVESISANKNDIFELIKRQGNFEAKIGNTTVFTGDNVLRVFNDPQNAGLQSCSDNVGLVVCTFAFTIEIDSEGGDQFFDVTKNLDVIGTRLSEEVTFFLDEREITSLTIASSFKYSKITTPQISVSGNEAPTREKAITSGQREMKFLQTILSTQSLPTELEVVQSYSISSSLGEKLLNNAVLVGIISIIVVAGSVALRYRKPIVFIAIFIALVAEIIIVFGVAAFLRLSIDLAAIGGLIAAIGTGVDDQIIITDEYFRKRKKDASSRTRVKAAMAIIMIAYLTTLAAMAPLYFAGLNILQGFAFMILVGVTVGVFITRPFYAQILRILMTTRKQRKEEDEEED